MKKIIVCILFGVFLFASFADADNGRRSYDKGVNFIKKKDHDFALMEFRSLVRNFPESEYARKALFAIGEYFYSADAYIEASKYFAKCVKEHPETEEQIFGRAYLLRIVKDIEKFEGEKKAVSEKLETEFFSDPLFLLFSEYKEVTYESAFQNKFTIRYYIDTIEIYKNGETFIKITQ